MLIIRRVLAVIFVIIVIALTTMIIASNGLLLRLSGINCTHFSGGIGLSLGEGESLNWFHLFQLKLLREKIHLDLSNSNVTDNDILRLIDCENLRSLKVNNNVVTFQAIEAFRTLRSSSNRRSVVIYKLSE